MLTRQRTTSPDLGSYLECVANRKVRYSKGELIFIKLFDYSHPFTIAIYCLVLLVSLSLKALLGKVCRRAKDKPKRD